MGALRPYEPSMWDIFKWQFRCAWQEHRGGPILWRMNAV